MSASIGRSAQGAAQASQQSESSPPNEALALVEFLLEPGNAAENQAVQHRLARFRALPADQQQRQLPSTFLFLRRFLSELEPSSDLSEGEVHAAIRQQFPALLEDPLFCLLLEPEDRQEALLCREFLRSVVSDASELLGQVGKVTFDPAASWLQRIPDQDESLQLLGRKFAPPSQPQGWPQVLRRFCHTLYRHLTTASNDADVRRLYEESYDALADQLADLDSFPVMIDLLPDDLLDEPKLALLSRRQTRRMLIAKLDELRTANRQLEENNADLQMALGVLERNNEELEQRVAERTNELSRVNEELVDNEERFRLISDTAQDALIMIDSDGQISFWNESAKRMFGFDTDAVMGRQMLRKLVPRRFHRRYEAFFRRGLTTGKGPGIGQTGEFVARRRNGDEFPVELSLSSVKVGGKWNLVGIVRDISRRKRADRERRRLEEQFQEAQRLESLGVLTGGIAHDFNNLLTTILGNVGLIEQLLPDEFALRPNLEDIHRAAQRAADLTQQMLAYSGSGQYVVEPLDLGSVVREITELMLASISKRATIDYRLAPDLPLVEADRNQLQQVVMNLVTNASDALEDRDGKITIHTSAHHADRAYLERCQLGADLPAGLYVALEIADNGAGMDAEVQGKMFEPFFSTKFTGRGLGLASVLGIVRGHRGAIDVHSEVDKGTALRILFPASQQSAGAQPPQQPLADWRGSGTILVVDDEPAVRFLARRVLEEFGFDVMTAADGLEAVEAFRQHAEVVDAILLDITMPNMDGEQALAAIQELRADARVILCSGYSRQETMERFTGRRVAGFVQKPYEVEALVQEVRQALQSKA